ncbi:unnamed protein product [Rhizophagus irregularis]|nr:unnamed protein product [Rhizophagus irregularis]
MGKWPINRPFAGSIQVRTLPNIGSFTNYFPIQIRNSSKIEITKLNPMISTPSMPTYPNTEIGYNESHRESVITNPIGNQLQGNGSKGIGSDLDTKSHRESVPT